MQQKSFFARRLNAGGTRTAKYTQLTHKCESIVNMKMQNKESKQKRYCINYYVEKNRINSNKKIN